ncbi:NeuD/PglB/VioB family sugar acetyltransferase [Thiopseudomonas alkaliphila]|nr:NeuD/PglB/VioB family sugar acetyltransferase [Thiopseudomonas alkaliphila]MDM1717158.1 NeuD/PglB/VioB family sugar acetyltransferase [Thiopseudomonas alkaliphila]
MLKRLFDIIASALGLIILSPVIAIVAWQVKKKLGSPVLFRQIRPGLNGKPFEMIKFRTMLDAYDKEGNPLPNEQRFTKFGNFLRSTSLDELPELWNVLKGDMSLVGPRPLLVEYLPLYNKEQARRHEVRPGVTGWAQVNGRNAISWEEKFELDTWYVDNNSLWLDIKILFLTVKKVFIREGISNSENVTMPKFKGSKQLIIVGASGFGKEVAWLAERLELPIKGFLDDNTSLSGKEFYGYPVLGCVSEWINYTGCEFVLAIASPKVRKKIVDLMFEQGQPVFKTLVDPSVQTHKLSIGKGCIVCAGTVITADVTIGDYCIVNKLCSIGHDVKIKNYVTVAPMVMLGGHVVLEEEVEIGASSAIRQGLAVDIKSMVGMGAIVTKSIAANTVVVGNPAKPLVKS